MSNFKIEKTFIKDLLIINSKIFEDVRGSFQEIYNEKDFQKLGIKEKFVQDNLSNSHKGVLRGLHFQKENSQAKLLKVLSGKIYDVVVDLRKDSETFGKYFGIILSAENNKMLFIPSGFAHGFLSLEDNTNILYKCSDFYNPQFEDGLIWDDKKLNIDWKFEEFNLKKEELIISEKDKRLKNFDEEKIYF
ncbi:MAG: dTDP-4-dehydrorhamnose 3,5-epimerase [Fusobacterium sp.]|nr:dTDP-4-dehydrorhamnose 3,5-epimerase [Fusobacterium sp.]